MVSTAECWPERAAKCRLRRRSAEEGHCLQRRANWKPGQITRMRHLRSAAPGQTPPSLQNAAVAKRPACKILSRGEIKRALPAVTPQTGRVYLSHRTGCGYDEISRARGGMPTKMIERYVAQLVLALETQGDRMNAEGSESGTAVIARARAEAAAWIARILRSARSTRVQIQTMACRETGSRSGMEARLGCVELISWSAP